MTVRFTFECFRSDEGDFANLVASVVLSIEESVVPEPRQDVRLSKDFSELVVVPAFMKFFTNREDVGNLSGVIEADIRALED